MDLLDLIRRSQMGDEEAFTMLFHQYKNLVYKTAYLLLGDAAEAEDVLQEVFVKVYHSLHTYQREKGAFTTWLHRITVNHCLNRRRKRRLSFSSLEEISETSDHATDVLPQNEFASQVESLYQEWEMAERIRRLVNKLSPKLRATVVLRYYHGLSYAEIAQVLGIPIGTVKSRLNEALRILRKELEAHPDFPWPGQEKGGGGDPITMKCKHVRRLLVAYLDGELTPKYQQAIRDHLERCASCREEMAALAATRDQLRVGLHAAADGAVPSPLAWDRLQARLAREAPVKTWHRRLVLSIRKSLNSGRLRTFNERGLLWLKRVVFAVGLVLFIAICVLAGFPSVRAQVGELVTRWFRIELPGGGAEFGVSETGETLEFTLLQPTYLPVGFRYSSVMVSVGPEPFKLEFYNDKHFVVISESKASADRPLPPGKRVFVGGHPGVLVTGLKGTFKGGLRFQKEVLVHGEAASQAEPIHIRSECILIPYDDGKRLIWYQGDVKLEMLSNLPEEEMIKVAESMAPVEGEEVPLGSPAGDVGKPFIIYHGPIE